MRSALDGRNKRHSAEIVRDVGGRPLFLTARRFIKICRWIERGESISDACRLELVTYQGFRAHVKRNPKYQRRLREAEETREEFLLEFHIANVRKHAPKNLLASLWWLERRYPNQFALRNVQRTEGASEQPIGDKIDEGQLRRYAALTEDFRRENEAKATAQTPDVQMRTVQSREWESNVRYFTRIYIVASAASGSPTLKVTASTSGGVSLNTSVAAPATAGASGSSSMNGIANLGSTGLTLYTGSAQRIALRSQWSPENTDLVFV